MKLDVRAWGLTCGIFFAGTVLVVGALNMALPGYGDDVLRLFSSIYPGYTASGELGDWLLGAVIGFVDGVIGGAIFAWLYNAVLSRLPDSSAG